MIKNKYYAVIIFLVIIVVILIIGIFFNYSEASKENIVLENINIKEENEHTNLVYIDIKGEVKKPGVYQVNENTIINDVIKEAGGLTKNAYTKNINLSKKVSNEMVIYIFSKKEINQKKDVTVTTPNISNEISTTTKSVVNDIGVTTSVINYDNCLTTTQVSEKTNDTQLKENELVNINSASKEMLMNIPGIGETKADAIIIYRQENSFKTIDDIKNVSGIGEALFVKIKDHITV